MTRIIKTCLLLVLPLGAWAQQDSLWNRFPEFYAHPFRTVKAGSILSFEGYSEGDASTMNNALLWKIYRQKDLNNEIIGENADRVQSKNLLGLDSRNSITWYNLNKGFLNKDSLHYFLRYGLVDHGAISYSGDFFKLIGQGNKAFEGDTAFGGGLDFRRSRYDYLDFGLIKFFPNRSNLSVSLGFTRGMRFIDIQAPKLQVYTAPYGTSTEWDVNLTARLSNGDEQTYQYVQGLGAQISVDYNGSFGPDAAYSVGVKNFGFMRWEGSEYTKDTTFTYDGWGIPDFGELNRPDAGQDAYDSIAPIFRPDSTGFERTALLPAYIYASYTMKLRGNQSLEFRFDKVINSPMLPRVSVGYTYFFGKMYGTTQISTGGFSRLALAQTLGLRIGNHSVRVQLYGIQAWAFPHKMSGLGGGIGYSFILGQKP